MTGTGQLTLLNDRPRRVRYPLAVEMHGHWQTGELMGFYSKGHHPPAAFLEAVRQHEDAPYCAMEELSEDKVRHLYWRCVPAADGEWSEFEFRETTPGPGAFPVTEIEAMT